MKATSNKIDELNIELTIEVLAADYAEAYRKKLADKKRTAEFKGFRKGNAPMSLIERVYGDQALVESVNAAIGDELDSYIKSENLNLLGEPMASDKQPENEWKSGNDFTFVFDLGLSPQISVDVVKDDAVTKYNIFASEENRQKMFESMKKYYTDKADKSSKDPVESEKVPSDAEKPETPAAEPEEGDASSQNEEVEPAKTDEDIQKEVDGQIASSLGQEADYQLTKDIRKYFVRKADVKVPEAFLKRWLKYVNEGKVTDEQIEKEFDGFLEDFRWQLVRGYLMKKFELEINDQDLFSAAEGYVRYQYAMYGMTGMPDDLVKESAARILQDGKQLGNLRESIEDTKVIGKIKEIITVNTEDITEEKFREIAK